MTEFATIPVIDVSALHSDDAAAKAALAREFAETYATTGFGYIANHGVDPALVERVFAASAAFHALPRRDSRPRSSHRPPGCACCITRRARHRRATTSTAQPPTPISVA